MEWRDVAFLGNADLWLTVDELPKPTAAPAAALEPHRRRALTDRSDDTCCVRIMNTVIVPATALTGATNTRAHARREPCGVPTAASAQSPHRV